jgi:hypothetical protein
MSRTNLVLAFAVSVSALSGVALAQDKQPSESREKMRAACATDVQKFCAGAEQAKGAVRTCLESNAAQLSEPCKAARTERAAERAAKGKT